MAFLSAAKLKEFEAEERALRLSMRTRATTNQLRSGEVPTIVFGARYARLFEPASEKAFFGGRGSGKSYALSAYEVIRADNEPLTIIKARQFQNSIRDSSKSVVEYWINRLGLSSRFKITDQEIWSRATDALFRFKGLDRNVDSLRSLEGVDICSVEEARNVPQNSIDTLRPTVLRKAGSELVSSWNPVNKDDPWDALYRDPRQRPYGAIVQRVGIEDNPYFYTGNMPHEMWRMKRQNVRAFEHVWLGEYDTDPESRIFHNTKVGVIDASDLEYHAPRYGMDMGFAADPTVVVKTYVLEKFKTIYVQNEAFGYGVPNNELGGMIMSVVDTASDLVVADSSEQRTIDYLQSEGFNIQSAVKGPGSIKAGINWLQGYAIVINPRCRLLIDEARQYKWQTNRLTGARLGAPVDAFNHAWDALRYATEDLQLGQGVDEEDPDEGVMRIPFGAHGFGTREIVRVHGPFADS